MPSFGPADARLLIVGLAPGLRGANRTGRPFTGDHAGVVLYEQLLRVGLAQGVYEARPDDGLDLIDCRITNAVRCVPPENKPSGIEAGRCGRFLNEELMVGKRPQVVLSLGGIAHSAVVRTLGLPLRTYAFLHGALYRPARSPIVVASYHCSRYNMNTGALTVEMFAKVFDDIRSLLDSL